MLEFPFLVLFVKMASAAALVVLASLIAEKSGPFIAGLTATFPVSAGPSLIFLAMDHDDAFIAATTVGSVGANVAVAVFCGVYVFLAQNRTTLVSLAGAFASWGLVILMLSRLQLPFSALLTLCMATYCVLIVLCRPLARAVTSAPPVRTWYAVPLRAIAVGLLVAAVTGLSTRIGPFFSGILAVFPIVMCSLIAILQPRIGGPATAAVLANSLPGMLGFGMALATVHLAAEPLGRVVALWLGLAMSFGWNGVLLAGRLLSRRRQAA